MYEMFSVGFDMFKLCLFVFMSVMLTLPLWLVTAPLAFLLSRESSISHIVHGAIIAGLLSPFATFLPGLFIEYRYWFGFGFLYFAEDMNQIALAIGFWGSTFLACYAQLWLWPIPGAKKLLKSRRPKNPNRG